MPLAGAVSVTAFSVILAESMAAVGLSSLIPAGAVTLARLAKELAGVSGTDATAQAEKAALEAKIQNLLKVFPAGKEVASVLPEVLQDFGKSFKSLDLLLPKTASVHAEFAFQAMESLEAHAGVGGSASVESIGAVSMDVGYSLMYQESSKSRIELKIEFVSTNVTI